MTSDLKQRLGEWIRPSNMQWNAQTHREQLFVKYNSQVLVHEAIELCPHPTGKIVSATFANQPHSIVTAMPKLSIPASIHLCESIQSNYTPMESTPRPPAIQSFKEHLLALPPAEKRLVHYFSELTARSTQSVQRQLAKKLGRLEAG
jgi:hypothetical protein